MDIMKLLNGIDSKSDFVWGAIFALIGLLFGIGWFSLITVPACSILWAMGGDSKYQKAYRRIGCAAVQSLGLILATGNLLFIGAGVAVYALLCIGYGLPSTQPPDEGSFLGRIFFKLAGGKEFLATVYTRGSIFAGVWAVYFVTSLLRGVLFG